MYLHYISSLHFIILSGRKDDDKYVWEKHGQLSFKINCKNTTVNRFFWGDTPNRQQCNNVSLFRNIILTREKLLVLLSELETARDIMNKIK